MKLIIDIPDEEYKQLHYSRKLEENLRIYVLNGKPYNERPKGEWKPKPVTFGTCFLQGFECECGRIVMQKENFCPDCGAQMVGGGENE